MMVSDVNFHNMNQWSADLLITNVFDFINKIFFYIA